MKLTDAEWKVLELLWDRGPMSTMEIFKELSNTTDWAKSTVITLLNRMTTKKSIYFEMDGKSKVYYPSTNRVEAGIEEGKNYSRRFFGGSLGLMIKSFIKDEKLTKEEIEEIQKIINGDD